LFFNFIFIIFTNTNKKKKTVTSRIILKTRFCEDGEKTTIPRREKRRAMRELDLF